MSTAQTLNAVALKPYLEDLGYQGALLRTDFPAGEQWMVPLIGFAQEPFDARTSCIIALDVDAESEGEASSVRHLGAPVTLVCRANHLEFWKETFAGPERVESPTPADELSAFFKRHGADFSPQAIYRAKTWGRFDAQQQLTFVDVGLMTAVETEIGEALGRLIERNVSALKSDLGWSTPSDLQGKWLLKSVFWLLAARILGDKRVPGFEAIDLTDIEAVFAQLAAHYGSDQPVSIANPREREAVQERAKQIDRFSSLAHVSTESLAYVYENTLISKETRQALGTHSTPAYLVDYVVGKLAHWIEKIPVDERNAFEPACGHAAFLVAAMRLLRELLPEEKRTPGRRRQYLRRRLHGCEVDSFALEIARLSLTLADIPNPDGWNLQPGDMFSGEVLETRSRSATILLANPPFENFGSKEKQRYSQQGVTLQQNNKAAELLVRTLPHMPAGAVFGVVVPQGILHSRKAASLRRFLIEECELLEVCLFPDKVFNKSDMESAVLLGRRRTRSRRGSQLLSYRRVRDWEMKDFQQSYAVSTRQSIDPSRFTDENGWDMHVPDLEEVWAWCQTYQSLDAIARIGQGLFYKGKTSLPKDAITVSDRQFPGAVKGFAGIDSNLYTHDLPREVWMSLDPDVIDRRVTGAETGTFQILLNYARVSRGPWRLKAFVDRDGHAVTSRFLTIRPRADDLPLEFLWALCNSPLANAYAYAHSMKRDVLAGTMRQMPVPSVRPAEIDRVVEAARAYLELVRRDTEELRPQWDPESARLLLMQLDAEVLRLYDLPPRLERQLLDVFAGWPRLGVPFPFDRYFPADFEPCFSLHEYLSAAFQESTAGRLRREHRPIDSADWSKAMQAALDAFQE